MKKLGFMLIVALIALSASSALFGQQSGSGSEATKAKLKQMEDAWAKAELDKDHGVAVIGPMVADDFAGYSSKGEMVDKSKLLDSLKNTTDNMATSKNDEMQVHIYDRNLASVTGTSSETGTDKDGQSYNKTYIWVDTWMLRNGKWQIVAEGVTELPAKK